MGALETERCVSTESEQLRASSDRDAREAQADGGWAQTSSERNELSEVERGELGDVAWVAFEYGPGQTLQESLEAIGDDQPGLRSVHLQQLQANDSLAAAGKRVGISGTVSKARARGGGRGAWRHHNCC